MSKRKPPRVPIVDDDGTTFFPAHGRAGEAWTVMTPTFRVGVDVDAAGSRLRRHLDTPPEVFVDAHLRRQQRAAHHNTALETAAKKRAKSDKLLNAIDGIKRERHRIAAASDQTMDRATDRAAARAYRDKVLNAGGDDPGDVPRLVTLTRNTRRRKKRSPR